MSRYGFHDLPEQHHHHHQQQQQQNRHVYHDELPLPTYEEVVGAAAASAGYKTEVLLAAAAVAAGSARNNESNIEDRNAQQTEVYYEPRYASSRKSSVLLLIALILIPLCALIVFIQVKGCSSSNQRTISTSSEFLDGDNTVSYSKCEDEKNNLLHIINKYLGSTESRKLLEKYETTLKNKEELESSLQNLREQVQQLNLEKEKLQWLLANANKTFTPEVNSDKQFSKVENSTSINEVNSTIQKNNLALDDFLRSKKVDELNLDSSPVNHGDNTLNEDEWALAVSNAYKLMQDHLNLDKHESKVINSSPVNNVDSNDQTPKLEVEKSIQGSIDAMDKVVPGIGRHLKVSMKDFLKSVDKN